MRGIDRRIKKRKRSPPARALLLNGCKGTAAMRKVSEPYQRKDRSGWYLKWRENGKRKHKSFLNKTEAEIFRNKLYKSLNSDVYTCTVLSMNEAIKEFQTYNTSQNLAEISRLQYTYFFNKWCKICLEVSKTSQISSDSIMKFVKERLKNCSTFTVKKNLIQLKTFVNWLVQNGYEVGQINWPSINTEEKARTDAVGEPVRTAKPKDKQDWTKHEGMNETKKLKEPKKLKEMRIAYQLHRLRGFKQEDVAGMMSKELGKTVTQYQVSRWVSSFADWIELNALPVVKPAKGTSRRAANTDILGMGARTDGRNPHK